MLPHGVWKVEPFPIPKKMAEIVGQLALMRIEEGVTEGCHGLQFMLLKKDAGDSLINTAMEMNKHAVRDVINHKLLRDSRNSSLIGLFQLPRPTPFLSTFHMMHRLRT